jgi:hypothetical protein
MEVRRLRGCRATPHPAAEDGMLIAYAVHIMKHKQWRTGWRMKARLAVSSGAG